MKKFISVWSAMAIVSAATSCDFYIALHRNENPTGEQLLSGYAFIVFFAIFALVCLGAHIENRQSKSK